MSDAPSGLFNVPLRLLATGRNTGAAGLPTWLASARYSYLEAGQDERKEVRQYIAIFK